MIIIACSQDMPSDTVTYRVILVIFFSGQNNGYRSIVTRATIATILFLPGLSIIATDAIHAMFAQIYMRTERGEDSSGIFDNVAQSQFSLLSVSTNLDYAIDWMPVMDVKDILINVFFFFFFYSSSFINIYYLNFYYFSSGFNCDRGLH